MVFVVANAKDDSPIKDAAIVIDPSKTVTTDENGNHVEEHCEALNNKEFGIKKDDFCDAKVSVEKLEGAKDFKWALMHPKTSKFLNFCNFRHFGKNQFLCFRGASQGCGYRRQTNFRRTNGLQKRSKCSSNRPKNRY